MSWFPDPPAGVSWQELDRWATHNDPLWNACRRRADHMRLTQEQRVRLTAEVLLREVIRLRRADVERAAQSPRVFVTDMSGEKFTTPIDINNHAHRD